MAINGTWTNELGSILTLQDQGNGQITGSYKTAVGGPVGQLFPVVGSYALPESGDGPIPIAWVVAWTGWDSETSWCGLLFPDSDTPMTTTWILTSTTPNVEWWQSMNVGMDIFAQTPLTEEQARKAARTRGASHPLKKSTDMH